MKKIIIPVAVLFFGFTSCHKAVETGSQTQNFDSLESEVIYDFLDGLVYTRYNSLLNSTITMQDAVTQLINATTQLSGQRIHPYTDLLVHDMGAGLSDNRPDFLATGSEWRTQPLWGLGLLQRTTGIAFYLHDGRARTIEEAIL